MIPRLISGCPSLAVSAAMRIVQAIASSQPPPSAYPLIAAITGLPMCSTRSSTCWPRIACLRPPAGVCVASSLMSAPAMNDFSPAPVRITARTASSCFSSRTARRSSSSVWVLSALRTLGRLTVRTATPPSRAIRRLSKVVAMSERERIHQPAEDVGGDHESPEHHRAGFQLLARFVAQQHGEHQRHEEREQRHQPEMTHGPYFLPMATSKASTMTRKFSSPAVIRNVLP